MALIMVISAPVGLPVHLTAVTDRVTSGALYRVGCQSTACLTFSILTHQDQQGWSKLLKMSREEREESLGVQLACERYKA